MLENNLYTDISIVTLPKKNSRLQELICLLILLIPSISNGQSITGTWKTIDDETEKPASIVEIYQEGDYIYGKIKEILKEDTEPDAICDECTDDRKNQPIKGMQILRNLKRDGKQWNGGTILDPANGKVYKCYLELVSADKLKLRGFIGFSLIGRTQYWYRSTDGE